MRAAGRASTDGTSTAHTSVDRVNGIHDNLTVGLTQMLHTVSTTNQQTVSLSTELRNYKQSSESERPSPLILITHEATVKIQRTVLRSWGFQSLCAFQLLHGNQFRQIYKNLYTKWVWHRHLFPFPEFLTTICETKSGFFILKNIPTKKQNLKCTRAVFKNNV